MKHLTLRILKITGEALLIVLVLLAIVLGMTRAFFPHIDSYKPYFEKWASEALHQQVKIGKVQAAWKGLHPVVSMDEVEIFNHADGLPLLRMQHLQVGANVISSLIKRQLVPSSITVLGTHIRVRRINADILQVNDIPLPIKAEASPQTDVSHVMSWFLNQGQIKLEDVTLDWEDQEGRLFHITQLRAVLSHQFFTHQLIGIATLLGDTPTRFRFVVNITEGGARAEQVRAECYVFIKDLIMTPWLKNKPLYGVQVDQGTLHHLQLWAVWDNGQWQQFQAVFNLKQTILNAPFFSKPLQLDQFAANIVWQRQPDGFSFAADRMKLMLNQEVFPITQLSMQQSQTGDTPLVQALQVDTLDLGQLGKLAENITSIPDTLKTSLMAIQPQGYLNHLLLRREIPKVGASSISGSTDFSELKTLAWHDIPAVDGLQGSAHLTPTAGDVQLDGNNLLLDASSWFDHPFTLAKYHGDIQWIKQQEGLKIQVTDFTFADAYLGVRTHLNIWMPSQGNPYVQLLAAFSEEDASHIKDYVPVKRMHTHPALSQWLTEAFVAGDGVNVQILLQGPLADFPFDHHTGQFEAWAHVKNMVFNYKTGWPIISHLDADAMFNDRRLDIQAPQANLLGASAHTMKAQIPNLAHAELEVQGNVEADMQDGLRFIAESPLQKTIGEGLENLALSGAMKLGLGLHIPLYHGSPTSTVQGNVLVLPKGKLDIPSWDIHLTDFNGAFSFTENNLLAKQLSAKWLGQPVDIQIKTKPLVEGHVIQAQIKGHTTVAKIQEAYGLDFLKDKVTGATDYAALLQLNNKEGHTQTVFSIDTNLQGVAINLPDPFKKSVSEKLPTHAEIKTPEKSHLDLFLQYAKKLSAALSLTQNQQKSWILQRGNIRLGEEPAELPTTPGLVVDGYLSQLIWSDVAKYLNPLFAKSSTKQNNFVHLQQIDLDVDQLTTLGKTLLSANISAQPQPDGWEIGIDSPTIVGQLTVPNDLSQPIVGDFERFYLAPSDDTKTTSSINPGDIPPLELRFKNFTYGNKSLGAVSLLTSSGKNLLQIKRLNVDVAGTHLLATGRWQQVDKDRQQTTLSGNLHSDNIGTALKNWKVTNSVVGGRGSMAFALSWPAAAYDFSTKQLDGSFSLSFGKGNIIHISDGKEAEMGMGRILNLLSFQSIPRRLSLDFSDLVQKGFPFDEMKGDFSMRTGDAVTKNAYLQGPIAKVEIKGRIGLGNKDYDLTMITTPHVTGSLPIAATIMGGPILGAATWLGNKVLGSVVNKITMHTYSVKGSWDDPVIDTVSANAKGS